MSAKHTGLSSLMDEELEPPNQEPEPDHEAARELAERLVANYPTGAWEEDINEMARAYLAQADELAALKETVRTVPHYATGSGNPRHITKDSPLHIVSICRIHQGRCKYEETPDA